MSQRNVSVTKKHMERYLPIMQQLDKEPNVSVLKTVEDDCLHFLVKCVSCFVNEHPKFRLLKKDRAEAKQKMHPYKKHFLSIGNNKHRNKIVKMVKKQNGRGLIISSLIAAAIPLITGFIQKMLKKK